MFKMSSLVWLALALVQGAAMAADRIPPGRDDAVLEVLPAITRVRPTTSTSAPVSADPAAVAAAARQDIAMARQTGETRYWGRAQAALAPWWNRADAPADLAVLQATVQQGRHEFTDARTVLTAALLRAPDHAQGWLNLAALERLSARYAASLAACEAVARAGQAMYASACQLETQSLQGQHELATQGLQALVKQTNNPGQLSWLHSLLAESLERAGRDSAAAKSYQLSLSIESDLYTSIAYSDLLLRTSKPAKALQALAALPETDAVVLRRAAGWKRTNDARWREARTQLQERNAELKRRGDDPALHGRELALAALWLDDDATAALRLARSNLLLQKEPLDWLIAVQSARQSRNTVALTELEAAIHATGLQDVRLALPRINPQGVK